MNRSVRTCFFLIYFLLGINVVTYAQTQEQKAAAMVEILQEQKNKEERRGIDKAKNQILSQNDSSVSHTAPPDWVAQLIVGSIAFSLFWFFIGRHLKDFIKIYLIKRKLEKMSPAERKQFFLENPEI